MARLTAEGEAVDYSRRLTVAQEQLAEYAAQKEEDAAGYLQQVQSLQTLLGSLLQNTEDGPAKAQLQAASSRLCQTLAEEAGEAKSFAAQQKADVERAKRSSSQVIGIFLVLLPADSYLHSNAPPSRVHAFSFIQAELAPAQDEEDVKRPREENGHANGHFQVCVTRNDSQLLRTVLYFL